MVVVFGGGGAEEDEEEEEAPAPDVVVEFERWLLQEGQAREVVMALASSIRHCQWKWQPQGRARSSGTVSPSSPDSSGSRARVSGSWQALQVPVILRRDYHLVRGEDAGIKGCEKRVVFSLWALRCRAG